MGRVKRSNALSWIFMRYVLVMLGSLVGLVIVAWLLLYLLISVGCIYPANYAEQKINEAYDTILRADKVTAEMIPAFWIITLLFFVIGVNVFNRLKVHFADVL